MPGRVTHPSGGRVATLRGALPRVPRLPTGWGRGSSLLPTGALPRGLGLSLEKAQTKEHQGAAAPWTPGGD